MTRSSASYRRRMLFSGVPEGAGALRRMKLAIAGLIFVTVFGTVVYMLLAGQSATAHLLDTGNQVVLVDRDETRFAGTDLPHVLGDASVNEVLEEAGIMQARALICALDTDAETTYATLSARSMRPDLVIISRARTVDSKEKLVLAGAARAVNPQLIGGRRMASFALHADVAEFLDEVLHDDDFGHRIQQVRLAEGSPFAGLTVADLDVPARFGCQQLAVRAPGKGAFVAAPPDSTSLVAGSTLIVFGRPDQVERVRAGAVPR